MPGSLKNSSYVESPNFPHRKLKNARNRIPLRQKDAPFNGESAQPSFVDRLWRENKKVRSPRFYSCTMSSFQGGSDSMLNFHMLS